MATRALYGILNNDGTVDYQYNHFDGMPSCLGATLLDCYSDEKSIRELLSFGDASAVGRSVYTSSFYARDRGEDLSISSAISTVEFQMDGKYADYLYLFKDGEWFYVCNYKDNPEWSYLASIAK